MGREKNIEILYKNGYNIYCMILWGYENSVTNVIGVMSNHSRTLHLHKKYAQYAKSVKKKTDKSPQYYITKV